MKVELIPVIEFGYYNPDIIPPDKHPYWNNAALWDKYHAECFIKAGFEDTLVPYLPSSSFFRLCDISDNNLAKLVKDHTQEFRNGAYTRQDACALYGGYVLRIDELDKFFPQCCGDLADIEYWDKLSKGQPFYYEGHPAPEIEIDRNFAVLDFSVNEFDEPFQPTPPETKLNIDLQELKGAVEKARLELKEFTERLIRINQEENLEIKNIEGLLIWENANTK